MNFRLFYFNLKIDLLQNDFSIFQFIDKNSVSCYFIDCMYVKTFIIFLTDYHEHFCFPLSHFLSIMLIIC